MRDIKVAKTLRMIYYYQWREADLRLQLKKIFIFFRFFSTVIQELIIF